MAQEWSHIISSSPTKGSVNKNMESTIMKLLGYMVTVREAIEAPPHPTPHLPHPSHPLHHMYITPHALIRTAVLGQVSSDTP